MYGSFIGIHVCIYAPTYRRFYTSYPPHPDEKRYKFTTCSTFKPTQVTGNSDNALCDWA